MGSTKTEAPEGMSTEEAAAKIAGGEFAEGRSKFDQVTDGQTADIEAGDEQSYVPRALFVEGAKPDMSKMQIPQLRIAQGMTPEVTERKAQIGQFVLTNFQALDEVILVPLGAPDIREYKTDPKKPPQCFSPTGTYGIGDPGIACADCRFSKWGAKNPATGKSAPPPCKEGVLIRAYSLTHRTVVDFKFLGRAQGAGRFLQQQIVTWGEAGFAFKLSSQTAKNDKGQWFEPSVEFLGEVPAEHKDMVGRWYEIHCQSKVTAEQANSYIALTETT